MPITSIATDPQALTLTVIANYPVPARRLWDAYLDPRQLQRFWGPEGWPATFVRHDGFVGGRSAYFMSGPDGERSAGHWEWTAVDAPHSFEVRDGFADAQGRPDPKLPTMRMTLSFADTATGSRLTSVTHFNSAAELEQLTGMGLEEGLRSAMGQIDAVVTDPAPIAAGQHTELQRIGEAQARVSRVVRGPLELVWRAHTEPEWLRRWQLGPDG